MFVELGAFCCVLVLLVTCLNPALMGSDLVKGKWWKMDGCFYWS